MSAGCFRAVSRGFLVTPGFRFISIKLRSTLPRAAWLASSMRTCAPKGRRRFPTNWKRHYKVPATGKVSQSALKWPQAPCNGASSSFGKFRPRRLPFGAQVLILEPKPAARNAGPGDSCRNEGNQGNTKQNQRQDRRPAPRRPGAPAPRRPGAPAPLPPGSAGRERRARRARSEQKAAPSASDAPSTQNQILRRSVPISPRSDQKFR